MSKDEKMIQILKDIKRLFEEVKELEPDINHVSSYMIDGNVSISAFAPGVESCVIDAYQYKDESYRVSKSYFNPDGSLLYEEAMA